MLENRFRTYVQTSRLVSGDRAGNEQRTRLKMWFRSFREGGDEHGAEESVLSKTLVKYTDPFDLRHSGYLIIHHDGRPSDQFVYLASNRRVRRVSLRGEAVFGTDFSFEDVVPRELEDADYERLPDTVLDGVPCFVVEAVPKPHAKSEYSRFRMAIEKERSVPLRTRYWDDREVEVKELRVERDAIERIRDVWVPRRMLMTQLRNASWTRLVVEEIEPEVRLTRSAFDLRRLEGH